MVSIITPAYNAAAFIEETILSVLNQTYEDWEMIIVDDCSTDSTRALIQKYTVQDSRIKAIFNDKNTGVAEARNIALSAAKGEYIAFLDSDDMWMPQKLERQISFMEANGYALTYSKYQFFNADNRNDGKVISVPPQMTYKSVFVNTAIACLTVIVNRDMVGDFRMPPLKHSEDQCTWQEIMSRGYIAYAIDENLAMYRTSTTSLTGNKKKAAKLQWETYRNYYNFSVIQSTFYFFCYAYNAVTKHLS